MDEDSISTQGWSPQTALTSEGVLPRRRRSLMVADIGLPLVVLLVIAVLASMLISYGDEEVIKGSRPTRVFSASRADAVPPSLQPLPFKETAFERAHRHEAGFRCPRHPEVISQFSGVCPICGERLSWFDGSGAEGGYLDKSATLVVGAKRLKGVPLFGDGWVERLMVQRVGAQVQQGELLMEVYVPDFRHGIERQEGVVRLYAPVSGEVRAIRVSEGMFVASGAVALQIEDSRSLWLQSTLSAAEAIRVRAGQRVELALPTDASRPLVMGEVDEVVKGGGSEGDATVWLRFDDLPALHNHSEFKVRIYAEAEKVSPPEKA